MKLLVAAALLSLSLAGCTSGELQYTELTPDADGKVYVEMTAALTFAPSHFQIPAGTTVVFTSTGGAHNVASDDGAWTTTEYANKGESVEVIFDETGDFSYFCVPHVGSGMKGVARVV